VKLLAEVIDNIKDVEEMAKKANELREEKKKQGKGPMGHPEGITTETAIDRKNIPIVPIPKQPYTLPQALLLQTWVIKEMVNIWSNLTTYKRLTFAPRLADVINKYGKRTEEIEYLKEAVKDLETRREEDKEERRELLSRSGGSDRATKDLLDKANWKRVSEPDDI